MPPRPAIPSTHQAEALDIYEYPGHTGFGAVAARQVDAFVAQLNWPATQSRYQRAVTSAAGDIVASHQEDAQQAAQISDARRAGADATAAQVIQGTRWQDLTRIEEWDGTLPADRACGVHRART